MKRNGNYINKYNHKEHKEDTKDTINKIVKNEKLKIKIKTGQILRSSKILITMGETHREKITCTHIELRSSSTKKDKTKMEKKCQHIHKYYIR
jgi:hypothetical protein